MPVRLLRMVRSLVDQLDIFGAEEPRAKALRRARTLDEFWLLHFADLLASGRTSTAEQYRYRWRVWIRPAFGHLRWDELSRPILIAWVTGLRTASRKDHARGVKLSPATIRTLFAALQAILSHAVDLEYLDANPATLARKYLPELAPSEANKKRPVRLTSEQSTTLIVASGIEPRFRAEYAFTIYTAARRGEALGLRWSALRLDDAIPYALIACSYNGPTKSGKDRIVPLHSELLPILVAWRYTWRKIYGREPEAADLVFPDDRGSMQPSRRVHLRGSLETLRLPPICYHGLRHTGAALYRAAGVRREDVAALLGHGATLASERGRGSVTDLYAPAQLPLLAAEIERLRLFAPPTRKESQGTPSGRELKRVDGQAQHALTVQGMPMVKSFPTVARAAYLELSPAAPDSTESVHPEDEPRTVAADPGVNHSSIVQAERPETGYRHEEMAALYGEAAAWDDLGYPRGGQ